MSLASSRTQTASPASELLVAEYRALSFGFRVHSPSPSIARAVDFIYEAMRAGSDASIDLDVEIRPDAAIDDGLEVLFNGVRAYGATGLGSLLHELDNQISVAIEHAVPRLYFVHAASLARDGRVTLLAGESGAGKSTTTYALATTGLDYLSDELSAIEPGTGLVHPYPRAICLKRDPPRPLEVPARHLRTEWTLHVQAPDLSSRAIAEPLPLERIVFVRYSPEHRSPAIRAVTPGEAALRLYQSALNQLAHPTLGLDETLRLVGAARCEELLAAGVPETLAVLLR